jgi:hypothetical protein
MLNIPLAELVLSFNKLTGKLYNVNNLDHVMLTVFTIFLKIFVCKKFVIFQFLILKYFQKSLEI